MKRMQIMSIILVTIMALSFAACSNKKNSGSDASAYESQSESGNGSKSQTKTASGYVESIEDSFKSKGGGWIPLYVWKEYGISSGISLPNGVTIKSASESRWAQSPEDFYGDGDGGGNVSFGGRNLTSGRELSFRLDNTDEEAFTSIRNDILSNSLPEWNETNYTLEGYGGQFNGNYVFEGITYNLSSFFRTDSKIVHFSINTGELPKEALPPKWPGSDFFSNIGLKGLTQPKGAEVGRIGTYFVDDYHDYASSSITLRNCKEADYNNLKNQISQILKLAPWGYGDNFEKEDLYVRLYPVDFQRIEIDIRW